MTARLTAIIVNYNSADWLTRCVSALLNHSTAHIVVVDNASQDDSLSRCRAIFDHEPRFSAIENTRNRGFAAANNQALHDLEADYALLINPDCEINATTIEPILQQFESHARLGLASCRILNEDGSIQKTCKRRFPTPMSALGRMLLLDKLLPNSKRFANFDYGDIVSEESFEIVEAVSGAFMLVRAAALREVGLLDEAYFMHCEDLDWCKRFAQAGWQVGFVESATVMHAKGVSSQSRPIKVLWTLHKGMLRFFDKFYRHEVNPFVRFTVVLGIYASFVLRAAKSLVLSLVRGRR